MKNKGRWHLTPEGEAVLNLPGEEILKRASKAYHEWKAKQPVKEVEEDDLPETALSETYSAVRSFVFEAAEEQARQEIEEYVESLSPYQFQELAAALLRGMGHSTPFVSPKGPDGGTDIVAYQDPLGRSTPHIRVQVKHRQNKATREEVAALRGVIRQDREVGLFISTAGFTSEAVREARQGTVHIELIDLDRFLDLWMAHYENLSEEDKGLLRLRRVYFLSPE
ncbi:MAG: restriction endonuclease [Proteobacteria bacterium]|nr:restriction endonuclease [Pseudomonadota bacterium]